MHSPKLTPNPAEWPPRTAFGKLLGGFYNPLAEFGAAWPPVKERELNTPQPAHKEEDQDDPGLWESGGACASALGKAKIAVRAGRRSPGPPPECQLVFEPGTLAETLALGPVSRTLELMDIPVRHLYGYTSLQMRLSEAVIRHEYPELILLVLTPDTDLDAAADALEAVDSLAVVPRTLLLVQEGINLPTVNTGFHRLPFAEGHIGDALLPLLQHLKDFAKFA